MSLFGKPSDKPAHQCTHTGTCRNVAVVTARFGETDVWERRERVCRRCLADLKSLMSDMLTADVGFIQYPKA